MPCEPTVIVHGGAGSWRRKRRLGTARRVLQEAVEQGLEALLRQDRLEAAVRAVEVMEDSGVFNAGRGSVRDREGGISMDAGVMDGVTGDAGAVAMVSRVANPVRLALEVMRRTPHVLIAGEHADQLAVEWGLRTLARRRSRKRPEPRIAERFWRLSGEALGDTVGAAVLDGDCNTAAAVSTGGVRGKLPGRVGDSPLVGAGFYAGRFAAAVATGVGEVIMLSLLSFRVVEGSVLAGGVGASAEAVVSWVTRAYGGDTVGVIGVDARGGYAAVYNTRHMPWAMARRGGGVVIGGIPSSSG